MIDMAMWEVADTDYGSERQLAVEPWRSAAMETGEARYVLVADTFDAIAAEFDERGCIPQSRFEQIWAAMRTGLPQVRDAADARAAMLMADQLFREVTALLSKPWPKEAT